MATRKLYRRRSSKVEHGPKRKIYSLTPAGFGEFYTAVVDSAKLFLNLLIEATFSQMGDQSRDALLQAGINLADMNKPKVYLDFNRPLLEFEMDVIRFILIPINKPMKIFYKLRMMPKWKITGRFSNPQKSN